MKVQRKCPRKHGILAASAVGIAALAFAEIAPADNGIFLLNRTESAPKGLYVRAGGTLQRADWAIVSASAPSTIWIAEQGFLAPGWPIIKRVAGVPGDRICRCGREVSVNGAVAATALESDSSGRALSIWRGCITLAADEFFLLSDHPRSLDGRYFGATKTADIDGKARLLWSVE